MQEGFFFYLNKRRPSRDNLLGLTRFPCAGFPEGGGVESLRAVMFGQLEDFVTEIDAPFSVGSHLWDGSPKDPAADYPDWTYTYTEETGIFKVYRNGALFYTIRKGQREAGLYLLEHEANLRLLMSVEQHILGSENKGIKKLDNLLKDGVSADFLSGILSDTCVIATPSTKHFSEAARAAEGGAYAVSPLVWGPMVTDDLSVDIMEGMRYQNMKVVVTPNEEHPSHFFMQVTFDGGSRVITEDIELPDGYRALGLAWPINWDQVEKAITKNRERYVAMSVCATLCGRACALLEPRLYRDRADAWAGATKARQHQNAIFDVLRVLGVPVAECKEWLIVLLRSIQDGVSDLLGHFSWL